MTSVLNDAKLDGLLSGLHQTSKAQDEAITRYYRHERTGPWNGMEPRDHAFMADKLVALDREKAEFCYMLCRAIGARRIFEAGTSLGVSTLYLAAAVRDNGGGVVFGAEYEPEKVRQARANFEAAGLSSFIDLREGDVVAAARSRLKEPAPPSPRSCRLGPIGLSCVVLMRERGEPHPWSEAFAGRDQITERVARLTERPSFADR